MTTKTMATMLIKIITTYRAYDNDNENKLGRKRRCCRSTAIL